MNIYTITQEVGGYDAYHGHVIVANNEDEARNVAINKSASEGTRVWLNAKIELHGKYTGVNIEPFILLSDFNAG